MKSILSKTTINSQQLNTYTQDGALAPSTLGNPPLTERTGVTELMSTPNFKRKQLVAKLQLQQQSEGKVTTFDNQNDFMGHALSTLGSFPGSSSLTKLP